MGSKELGWRCRICGKLLTAKPLRGKVVSHQNRDGGLCPGSGTRAVNLATPKKSKRRRATVGMVASKVKQPKSSRGQYITEPAQEKRERPDVLPPRKSTGALPVPPKRGTGAESWALLSDNPRQDLEMDAEWRRVRLGTSQGTGKRR